jgi:hypothetical protein
MGKYRVAYKLYGYGNYYVEAPSVELAYAEMFDTFQEDNSLIVHAEFPSGFEIIYGADHEGDFPKPPKARVTTSEELWAARNRDTLDEVPPPPKFADTGLFDFDTAPEGQ